MCKVKDQLLKEQDNLNQCYEMFYCWIDDLKKENGLSENDINKMEEDFFKSSTTGSLILSKEALNNQNFNPKEGA